MKALLEYFGIFKEPIVGVDISSSSVKVMYLEQRGEEIHLIDYGIEKIYTDITPKNRVETLSEALKRALEKTTIQSQLVAMAVSSSQSFTKIIQFDAELSDKEVGEELQLEADRYIPYPLEEVMLDYQILGPSAKNPALNDVLLAVSKSDKVAETLEVIEKAGLKPIIVDIDSFAKERAFSLVSDQLLDHGKNKTVALVDIGGSNTTMDVFHNFRIVYSRGQNFGGRQLIDEIQGRYGLSLDETILALEYGGLPEDYNVEVLEPFKQTIAQQISRACQFFFSAEDYSQIDYLFITGGVSDIPGLDKIIENMVSIKTAVANPFNHMILSEHVDEDRLVKDAPTLLSGCGLAMRNVMK
ncbi:MAG: type IV pilus assembly protein PilM [Francisellaceae bacterium]|jgi:type IV pilus assembly protein PilM|nr:type IV pilus assembly protein PilM [Francisellaceae bacterium]MBT6538448.1 type IV pilus assembly protein PilM [Francisellaceae bacterium]